MCNVKTYDMHGYHGITHRDDDYGWVIQIKLMGKYRMLRTFANGADEAARRYDMALSKLDSFTEANARPNFPSDYDNIDLMRSAAVSDSDKLFFDELQKFFSSLCSEAESAGLDPSEMRTQRLRLARMVEETRKLKASAGFIKFMDKLVKLRNAVTSLPLPVETQEKVADALRIAHQLVDGGK